MSICTRIKGKKENLNINAVTMIDPVTGWFKIMQYDIKRVISTAELIETTWLTRYPKPTEIMYDQGSEFVGHEFIKSLIEMKYGVAAKPSTLLNPTSNVIL